MTDVDVPDEKHKTDTILLNIIMIIIVFCTEITI